jgi:hypothetical protein
MLKNKIKKINSKNDSKNDSDQPRLTCQTCNPGYETEINQ